MGLRLHVNNLSSFHISTEFRAVKEKHDFFEVCQNPELACEVTLQVTVLIIISSIGSAPILSAGKCHINIRNDLSSNYVYFNFQPIDRFNLDASIIFSDILVIPQVSNFNILFTALKILIQF